MNNPNEGPIAARLTNDDGAGAHGGDLGQEQLADERPDRDPEVKRQRVEAEGLPGTTRRRKIGDGGEPRDEEERLGGPEQQA